MLKSPSTLTDSWGKLRNLDGRMEVLALDVIYKGIWKCRISHKIMPENSKLGVNDINKYDSTR